MGLLVGQNNAGQNGGHICDQTCGYFATSGAWRWTRKRRGTQRIGFHPTDHTLAQEDGEAGSRTVVSAVREHLLSQDLVASLQGLSTGREGQLALLRSFFFDAPKRARGYVDGP